MPLMPQARGQAPQYAAATPPVAAAPKVVQDMATCIPLLRLFGRYLQPVGHRPMRAVNQRLRHVFHLCYSKLPGQSQGKADPAAPPGELRGTWPAGVQPVHDAARAVYIQVKGARGLVKPQLHGLESTYSAHATVVV
ncbi:hypothetical protein HaLaN_00500 [Haematococcus lacustris]|uniref:Uncharacterized protein n=1 Tax=Haematococcus lacustris TaxID=44745 RepID=A0A699YJ48_HAELA|nr:hypothetical protein HaLaN_00500 [Haematococcus lacustris]